MMQKTAKKILGTGSIIAVCATLLAGLFVNIIVSPEPEPAEAAGPTLTSTISYSRDLNPTRIMPFCEGIPYWELDCDPDEIIDEFDILPHGPKVEEWSISITTTLVGAATGWGFCDSNPELYIDALRNQSVLDSLAPQVGAWNYLDLGGSGIYAEGFEGEYSSGQEWTFTYTGLVYPGNKNKLTFTPQFYICGPKTPGSSIMTWQFLTGKSTKLPAVNKWPTVG